MPTRFFAAMLFLFALLTTSCGVANMGDEPVVITPSPTSQEAPTTTTPAARNTPSPAEEVTASPAPASAPAATTTEATSITSVATPPPSEASAEPATATNLDSLSINLRQITTLDQPLHITHAGDGSGRLFVVEKAGRVIILQDGTPLDQPFLDIRSRVGSDASERGLLSIAFHPDYASNGQFFLNYTNLEGNTIIARYQVTDDANVAEPNSENVLLVINQPAANHNGGHILFGPDGYLYIGMGDGGQAGDPWGNAQNRNVLLGKILRIDVDGEPPYAIPPDNPFVGQEEAQPEIWAWGVRNPWRMTFDRATGDFYIADVGQNMYEEVHLQPASSRGGENYGWDIMEGAECFPETETCDKAGLEMPIVVYSHRAGNCSITGGYVYRGPQFPVMHGIYFYADYCSGMLWALNQRAGDWQNRLMLETGMSISSFGEDEQGELYVTDLWGGGVYQVEGDGRP